MSNSTQKLKKNRRLWKMLYGERGLTWYRGLNLDRSDSLYFTLTFQLTGRWTPKCKVVQCTTDLWLSDDNDTAHAYWGCDVTGRARSRCHDNRHPRHTSWPGPADAMRMSNNYLPFLRRPSSSWTLPQHTVQFSPLLKSTACFYLVSFYSLSFVRVAFVSLWRFYAARLVERGLVLRRCFVVWLLCIGIICDF